MNQPARFALVLCLFLALAACTGNTATPTPSATPLPPAASPLPAAADTPTAAAPPSPEPTITAENTPIPATPTETRLPPPSTSPTTISTLPPALDVSCYHKLSPGYYWRIPMDGVLYSLATDGQTHKLEVENCIMPESLDGKFSLLRQANSENVRIPRKYSLYDLESEQVIREFQIFGNDTEAELSPDGRWMAYPAIISGTEALNGIDVLSLQDGTRYFLTVAPEAMIFFRNLTWSPDGRWLAYGRLASFQQPEGDYGVYVLDVSCLQDADQCANQPGQRIATTDGVYYGYTWSSDGRYLTGWFDDFVIIYDVLSRAEKKIVFHDKSLCGLSWLPNELQMVLSISSGDVYLLSLDGSELGMYKSDFGCVKGWFTILPPFAPGLELSVSLAGHDLNLRAEPSLGGAVLRKLAPGTRLTILEGPVEADGYTWWKMQTEDGSEGWAVEVGVWYQPVSGGQ